MLINLQRFSNSYFFLLCRSINKWSNSRYLLQIKDTVVCCGPIDSCHDNVLLNPWSSHSFDIFQEAYLPTMVDDNFTEIVEANKEGKFYGEIQLLSNALSWHGLFVLFRMSKWPSLLNWRGKTVWESCWNLDLNWFFQCGKPTQRNKCNVCGANIGGTNYTLRRGNTLAKK